MSDGKIRFGVAGTNSITDWFLKGAMLDKRFELAAVCSRNIDKAKAFGNKYGGAAAYSSINEMAESPDVDAVYIAVPNSVHAQYALACMNAGKHVLCENPAASNATEFLKMTAKTMFPSWKPCFPQQVLTFLSYAATFHALAGYVAILRLTVSIRRATTNCSRAMRQMFSAHPCRVGLQWT